MRRWVFALLVVAIGLAGCIGSDPIEDEDEEVQQTEAPEIPGDGSSVVVAVVDSGINLYHEEYRAHERWVDANASEGNATSIPRAEGASVLAPASAVAPIEERVPVDPAPVELTADADSWEDAVDQDRDRLLEMEPRTLYTFPGTKILGGISFVEDAGGASFCIPPPCEASEWPVILDQPGGHGTMTTSRAVANNASIGGDDPGIWLVMVQGFSPEAVDWAAEQAWIDMISISSGLSVGGVVPAAANVEAQAAIESFDEASHAKPLFASSGNGAGNGGAAGFPSWLRGASGVPDAVSVGATDNGNLGQWDNQDSYIAGDGCSNPAATADSLDAVENHGGGTSSSTPFSAGGAAAMLLEARRALNDTAIGPRVDENRSAPEDAWDSGHGGDARVVLAEGEAEGIDEGPLADGVFTMREFKDVLYHTALKTPTEDDSDGEECGPARNGNPFGAGYVPAESVPEDARFPFQGYGEVNRASIEAAIEVLHGEATIPQRPTDDWHYERAHSHKQTFVTGEPALPPSPPAGQG